MSHAPRTPGGAPSKSGAKPRHKSKKKSFVSHNGGPDARRPRAGGPKKPHRKGTRRPVEAEGGTVERRDGFRPARHFDDRPARRYDDRRPARRYDERPVSRSFDDRAERGDRQYRDGRRDFRDGDYRRRNDHDYRDDRRNDHDYRDDRRNDRNDRDRNHRDDRRRDGYREDRPRRREDFRQDNRRREDRSQRPFGDRRDRGYDDRRPRERDRRGRFEENYPEDIDRLTPVAGKEPVAVGDDNGFAAMGLPARLVAALAEAGISSPFAIQGEAIPTALQGSDLLARAATGSGKTLAFGLPLIAKLADVDREPHRPHAMVIVPTRELAMQVMEVLAPLGKSLGLRMVLIAGGMPYKKQLMALETGVDVLIATPGRLIDLIERGAADLSDIRMSVLDEADQMCDMGFAPEVTRILDETPDHSQRMLFSATLDGDVDKLVNRFLSDPVRHSTADVTASVDSMEHHVFVVHPGRKAEVTAELASREGRSIVFVRTKLGADRVAGKLRDAGVGAAALHGGLNQGARTRTLSAFREGHVPVLVATDVAARGIHIDDVELVVQADPPADHKTYLHRAGRTARAGGSGSVVTLAMPRERGGVERTTRLAGLKVRGVYVEPGDPRLERITGGSKPSGIPVEEYRAPAPVRKRRPRRDFRDGNGGGRETGYRRNHGRRPQRFS